MKKNNPIVKSVLVLIVVAVLGYLNLDVPQNYVEDVVESQMESLDTNSSEPDDVSMGSNWYPVLSVIDGDTVRVEVDGLSQTVRVLGIDTPETEFSSAGEECYANQATAHAKLLLEGTVVQLVFDETQPKTDAYDRLLAYVQLSTGEDFGQLMIQEGFAREYTYKNNSYEKQAEYINAEGSAMSAEKGIWSCST